MLIVKLIDSIYELKEEKGENMKIINRAWISIMRRKANSFVLLLIVFVLANVLLITLTVTTSLKDTKQLVLKQFPPVVKVIYDYYKEDIKKWPDSTAEMADNLYSKTKDIVKSYDYTLTISFDKTPDIEFSGLPGTEADNRIPVENIYLRGTQLPKTSIVAKDEGRLISGNGLSESDIKEGKPKVIISKQFAEANGFEVGSYLTLNRKLHKYAGSYGAGGIIKGEPYFSEDIEFEVVGIIEIYRLEEFIKKQAIEPTDNQNDINQMETIANTLHSSNNYINMVYDDNQDRVRKQYPDQDPEKMPDYFRPTNVEPEFVLKDMKDLDKFSNVAKEVYSEKYFVFQSSAKDYETIAKPLNSMEDLLDLVFKITIVASIVVLTLVLCIFMYLRQKEMGIFLALGERRKKIVGQLMMETIIVAIVGATLAIITAMIFSNMLSKNLMEAIMMPSNEPQYIIYGGFNLANELTPELILGQYQGGFSVMTLVIFYITMILTIIVSQLATVLYLLRLNPKKILM